ncbi:glutamate receptor ionotropic, kainate glr-3-like isoform X2 [Daphnia pulex]|uniref:glutamate receptor ionotropic, kainate glr-3-like isoform X2 n=1 Tax=Daphnia pulex TaxID=6669 RepID=UPI001EE0AB31|nr:glutamate receptor ionotropic, kainate glr-3-like isoform X2 [Daphnia pulex]
MKILDIWPNMAFLLTCRKQLISILIIITFLLITGFDFAPDFSLSGRHLKFVAFDNPPFDSVVKGPNGTFIFSGATTNVVFWIAQRLRFTPKIVAVDQTLFDKLGAHEATFYQLMNQDVDGIVGAFYLTMDRVERMDYSFFTWTDGFSLVVPNPGEESRLFAFVRPFQPWVWMSILLSLPLVVGTMTFFTWFYNRGRPKNSIEVLSVDTNSQSNGVSPGSNFTFFGSHMIYVINTMTNQGGREAVSRFSFRVLAGAWVLCAMVLVNSYTGIVTSALTTPKMKQPINTLEELAASKEVKIVLRSDTAIGVQILQATSGIYKVLADQARSEPDERIVADPGKLNERLRTGRYAYPFMHTFTIAFVGTQYKKEGKCRFKASKILSSSHGYYFFVLKKGSWYTQQFSRGFMDLWESGLTRFWMKNRPTIPRADECFDTKRRVSRLAAIQLSDLTSAFLILGIGIGLATLAFLLEMIYSKWQR